MTARPFSTPGGDDGAPERQRVEVLSTLLRICRSLEGLQISPEAKIACREVHQQVAGLLARERRNIRRR